MTTVWAKFCDKDRLPMLGGATAGGSQSVGRVRKGVPGKDHTERSLERWVGVSRAGDLEGQDHRMAQWCQEAEPTRRPREIEV